MDANKDDVVERFIDSKSQYFRLADGENRQVIFHSLEEIDNPFDGGRTRCLRYHLETSTGARKIWDSSSRKVAEGMKGVLPGTLINITRTGEGNRTRYVIERA